jgi:hypothetical protein
MERGERCKMTVTFKVTEPQALALQAMFEDWTFLGRAGCSRSVAFFCDGDGDFRPDCGISFDRQVRGLTKELRQEAKTERRDLKCDFLYDYDSISWDIYHQDPDPAQR